MLARFAVLCAVALTAGPVAAQSPAPPPDALAPPPPVPGAADVLAGIADGTPTRFPGVSTDLLIGLPFAVRVQTKVIGPLWAEAGAGLWVIIPDIFAGLRLDVGLYRGQEDVIAVRPGASVHAIYNIFHSGSGWLSGGEPFYPGVGADVDLIWQHCWTDRFRGHVGLKIGAVTVFGENTGVVPTAALLFGCQF